MYFDIIIVIRILVTMDLDIKAYISSAFLFRTLLTSNRVYELQYSLPFQHKHTQPKLTMQPIGTQTSTASRGAVLKTPTLLERSLISAYL